MEIALGGLIILVILLPGISFRKGYFSQEFTHQYTIRDFFQLFINTLFPSLIAYSVYLPIIYTFGYFYDFKTLLGILSSNEDLVKHSIEAIDSYKFEIILFQVIINSSLFFVGFKLRDFVLSNSYDAKNKFLRYKNIWHYLLSAKFILFERSQIELTKDKVDDVDITYIDALQVVGAESFIYTGILVDYELSNEGSLDLLYIKNAQRKNINSGEPVEPISINGHALILKYEHIINLNLSFIQVIELEDNNVKLRLIE